MSKAKLTQLPALAGIDQMVGPPKLVIIQLPLRCSRAIAGEPPPVPPTRSASTAPEPASRRH